MIDIKTRSLLLRALTYCSGILAYLAQAGGVGAGRTER